MTTETQNPNPADFEDWVIPKQPDTLLALDVSPTEKSVELLRDELTAETMNSFPLWFRDIGKEDLGGAYFLEGDELCAKALRELRDGTLDTRGQAPGEADSRAQIELFNNAKKAVELAVVEPTADMEDIKLARLRDVVAYFYMSGVDATTIRSLFV